jgi:hypothetical protein
MRISSNMLPQRAAYFSDGPTRNHRSWPTLWPRWAVFALLKTRNRLYAKNTGRLQERLDVYWIVHNFVRVHFTTRQVPAVALGILDHGFALHELFLIQKAA